MKRRDLRWIVVAFAIAAFSSPRPEFDVAAIREVPHSKGKFKIREPNLDLAGNRFTLTTSLRGLIEVAWDVREIQVSGPAWLDSNAFQIVAGAPSDTTNEQVRLMCQSLLVDRFGMKFHREKRQELAYALVPAKGGPRLITSVVNEARSTIKSKPGRIASPGGSMMWLAEALSRTLGRPVVDKTGVTGNFRILLSWTADGVDPKSAKFGKAAKSAGANDSPPSLFTAIQEQLGLRLESQRALVDVLVVDHINRSPTEN